MVALEVWGMFVHDDEIKLHNWQALSDGGVVEGEYLGDKEGLLDDRD